MKGFRGVLQGLAGILLAGCAAGAVSTRVLAGENDLLYRWGSIRFGAFGLGAGAALIVTLLFADGWIGIRKRRIPEGSGAGRLLNGIGFGLLPGIAVWKVFEHETVFGRGLPVPEDIPRAAWLTKDGVFQPARAEMILAMALFAAVCLWLILRKRDLPENGDLLTVCAALWAAGRTVTEGFRAEQPVLSGIPWAAGWAALTVMAAALAGWTVRAFRQKKNTGYACACVPVFAAAGAALALMRFGLMLGNNAPAALAVEICCALLAVKAVLCMGRVTRPAE